MKSGQFEKENHESTVFSDGPFNFCFWLRTNSPNGEAFSYPSGSSKTLNQLAPKARAVQMWWEGWTVPKKILQISSTQVD